MLLKGDRNSSLNAADHLGKASGELWLLFLINFSLIILFVRNKDIFDSGFLCNSMDVQNALITFRENRLVANKLKQINLCLEEFRDGDTLILVSNDITLVNLILVFNVQTKFNILSWLCISNSLIFAIVNSLDLTLNV